MPNSVMHHFVINGTNIELQDSGARTEIGNLRNDLNDLAEVTTTSEQDETTTTLAVTINDGYLASNGNVYHGSSYDTHGYTDMINVQPGDVITTYNAGSTTPQANVTVLVAYNDGAKVSGSEAVSIPYTVPNGVNGIKITFTPSAKNATITRTQVTTILTPILKPRVETLETEMSNKVDQSDVDALASSINDKVDKSLMQKCTLVEREKSPNIWDKDSALTGLIHTNGRIYTGGSYDNFCYGGYIPVETGDILNFYGVYNGTITKRDVTRITSYDSSGTVMSSSGSEETKTFTIPEGVKSVRLTVSNSNSPTFMALINNVSDPSEYIPYYEAATYYVASGDFVPVSVIEDAVQDKVDKDGTQQIVPKNCTFMGISPNLFDPESVVVGLLNKYSGVLLPSYTDWRTSDWIEIDGESDYVFSTFLNTVNYYYCWYSATKQFISGGELSISSSYVFTPPETAKYYRFSYMPSPERKFQFEKGSTPTEYMAYGTGYILPECIRKIPEVFPLNLPSKVYASVGVEINLYFDNMVDGKDIDYIFDTTCDIGMQLERGYRVNTTASSVGSHTLTITAKRKTDGSVVTKSASLIVADDSSGSGETAKVIILGDSTTDGSNPSVITKLHSNFENDVMAVSTIGTRGNSPNNHEGRSGWRFETYMTTATSSGGVVNAFYNPTTETFDANYYFSNSGVAKPDWFFINLGINDMFGATTDGNAQSSINANIARCNSMIASIHSASARTKVVVCLTIPPNYSQDAFGKEYKNGQTRARYKRNNILWVQRLMEEYENRESEGIYVCPINLSLDTVYNMGFETLPVNARNTDITYSSPVGNGGVHPVVSGYWQIADVYKAFLKANV